VLDSNISIGLINIEFKLGMKFAPKILYYWWRVKDIISQKIFQRNYASILLNQKKGKEGPQ
jgi:hypothetical protein